MSRLRLPPAWLLVLIGLVLNVLAILMSSIVLDRLSGEIAELTEQKNANVYSIQLAWNSVETLERKREVLLLHVSQAQHKPTDAVLNSAMMAQFEGWLMAPIPVLTVENIPILMMRVDKAQQRLRKQIDTYYLDNITITEVMIGLNDRIAWYKNIGLFLQVFGLALILARDLARKP